MGTEPPLIKEVSLSDGGFSLVARLLALLLSIFSFCCEAKRENGRKREKPAVITAMLRIAKSK